MKLKLYKNRNGDWFAGVNRGRGGVGTLVISRMSKSLFHAIKIFTPKNIWRALKK